MRGTIAKVKKMHKNSPIATACQITEQKGNISHTPFPCFSNSDDVLGRVHGVIQDPSRVQWDDPVLDRLSTRDWWDVNENERSILLGCGNEESIS